MDHVFDARAMIQLADVQTLNDTGQAQTVTVMTGSGAIYSDVEVVQSFGMSGRAPVDGCLAMLFAVGGDPANMRAMLFNPSYRFGNQAEGEMTMFAPDGTRVSCRAGGIVDIIGGNVINIKSPSVTITASGSVTADVTGDVTLDAGGTVTVTAPETAVNGNVTITGNLLVNSGSIAVNGVRVIVP